MGIKRTDDGVDAEKVSTSPNGEVRIANTDHAVAVILPDGVFGASLGSGEGPWAFEIGAKKPLSSDPKTVDAVIKEIREIAQNKNISAAETETLIDLRADLRDNGKRDHSTKGR